MAEYMIKSCPPAGKAHRVAAFSMVRISCPLARANSQLLWQGRMENIRACCVRTRGMI